MYENINNIFNIYINNIFSEQIERNTIDGSGRYNVLDDGTLMIKNIEEGDQGVYECIARNNAGESMARPAELRTETVQELPGNI